MIIDVRVAVESDADAIATAHVASWRTAYSHIFPSTILGTDSFSQSRFDLWRRWTHSNTPDRQLFVATIDDAVVGFSLVGDTDEVDAGAASRCGEIHAFYSHPDAWGTGVGAELMTQSVRHLGALGHGRAVLWTLVDANRARSFYERSGWVETGRSDQWLKYPDHPVGELEYEFTLPT